MKLKLFLRITFYVLLFTTQFSTPVHAQPGTAWDARCVVNEVATIQGLECLFANVLQVIVYIAGIAFLFMFITGGFQYLFSDNDPKKVAASSSTLTMAIAGLLGLIASFFILRFIASFTGISNVTNFLIPGP